MQDKDAPGADETVRAVAAEEPEADAPRNQDEDGDGEGDTFDLEVDGQVHTLPAALKGAFLRHADYTRKTQELAHHRRALIAEREAVAQQAQNHQGALSDQAHLAALNQQLSDFARVDWQALSRADPRRAQALWAQCEQTHALAQQYAQALSHHHARAQLVSARDAAARMAETGRRLGQDIEGWSPELAGKLVDYARGHGVTLEELGAADDPRVWKILHRAYQGDSATRRDGAAASAVRAQAVRPAILVSGAAAGGGGVRDELATKEWMTRRNEQMRKGR